MYRSCDSIVYEDEQAKMNTGGKDIQVHLTVCDDGYVSWTTEDGITEGHTRNEGYTLRSREGYVILALDSTEHSFRETGALYNALLEVGYPEAEE